VCVCVCVCVRVCACVCVCVCVCVRRGPCSVHRQVDTYCAPINPTHAHLHFGDLIVREGADLRHPQPIHRGDDAVFPDQFHAHLRPKRGGGRGGGLHLGAEMEEGVDEARQGAARFELIEGRRGGERA